MNILCFDTVTKTRGQDTWHELDTNKSERDRIEYAEKVSLLPLRLLGHGIFPMPQFHAKSNFFQVELKIDALDHDAKVCISLQKRQLLDPIGNEWEDVQSDRDRGVLTNLQIKPQRQLDGVEKLSICQLNTEGDEIIIRGPVSSETHTVFEVKLDCSVDRQGMKNDLVPLFRFVSQFEDSQGNILNVSYGKEFFLLNRSTKQDYALRMAKALEIEDEGFAPPISPSASLSPSISPFLSPLEFSMDPPTNLLNDPATVNAENVQCGKRSHEDAFGYMEDDISPLTKEAKYDLDDFVDFIEEAISGRYQF